MAAPTVVGTAVGGRIGFGTYVCTPPAGAAFYVAFVGTNSIPNLIPPPNWTLLASNNGASTGSRWAIYTAPASASPGATWERGGTSSTGVQAVVVVGYDQAVTLGTPVTAASATSPAMTATGEGLALRLLTRLPSTNADPTYPTTATLGRNVSRQYQAAGNAVEVAVAHQAVSAAGAVATAAWSASTSGDITAFTVMAYGAAAPTYETVAGASTASLASPAARWVKGTMRPVWSDGDTWSAILPTSTGHRRYADLESPSAGAVVDSRQDARLTAAHYGGTTFVLRAHTSSSLFSSFDPAWSTIVNGASFPLTAADLDASPIALHRSPNGYLWAAVGESGAIKVTRSTDGGATWTAATTLVGSLTDTAIVGFGQADSTVVLVANGNTGIGRWVRSIDQSTASIAAGSWATETLPALPSGVTSDDHLAVTSVPDGRVLAVAKTTDATTSGHPLIYLLVRAANGTWASSTIEPGPDVGGVRYTRPTIVVVGSTVEVMYGSIEDPKNLTIRTAALSDLTTWSTRAALFTGPDWSDSAALPPSSDVRRHGTTYPVLAQQRADSTIAVAWRDAPAAIVEESVADSLGIADAVSTDQGRTLSDQLGMTDAVATSSNLTRASGDSVGVGDAVTTVAVVQRIPADGVGVTDEIATAASRPASPADAAAITDSADAALTVARSGIDGVSIVDVASTVSVSTRSSSDPLGILDNVSAELAGAGEVIVVDPVGIHDEVSVRLDRVVTVADFLALADSAGATGGGQSAVADQIAIGDQVTLVASTTRPVPDGVGVGDTAVAVLERTLTATISDGVGVTDAATASSDEPVPVEPELTIGRGPYGHPLAAGSPRGNPLAVSSPRR